MISRSKVEEDERETKQEGRRIRLGVTTLDFLGKTHAQRLGCAVRTIIMTNLEQCFVPLYLPVDFDTC